MKLIENSARRIDLDDFYDKVATVAHNCYQVKDKDHESNILFVKRLIDSRHLAMVEHFRFIFSLSEEQFVRFEKEHCPFYTLVNCKGHYLLGTSLRPIIEHFDGCSCKKENAKILLSALPAEIQNLFPKEEILPPCCSLFDLEKNKDQICEKAYEKLHFETYHLITDHGVTHALVRHRVCSFAQESTRYCNYTKDKFENSLTFMKPLGYEEHKETYDAFYKACEEAYFKLIEEGCRPDEARSVLPNSLKASIMVTCSLEEWKIIFALRMDEHAHPDIRRVTKLVHDDMVQRGLLHD